jgi:Mycothiol maleylpyruvate isomerase N-terminal domain
VVDCVDLLSQAYRPLLAFAARVDEQEGWLPSLLPGWCVRDLLFHLASDCQRALVAFATPSHEPIDTDEVSYWSEWKPGTLGAQNGLRGTRIMASAWTSVRGPADLYVETGNAVLTVAATMNASTTITTQGRVMTVDSLVRTLAVEAAVHHLDLEPVLPDPPAGSVLAEVRRVLDRLLGQDPALGWDDVRYARVGTGRLRLSPEERAALRDVADRFPLFG